MCPHFLARIIFFVVTLVQQSVTPFFIHFLLLVYSFLSVSLCSFFLNFYCPYFTFLPSFLPLVSSTFLFYSFCSFHSSFFYLFFLFVLLPCWCFSMVTFLALNSEKQSHFNNPSWQMWDKSQKCGHFKRLLNWCRVIEWK